MADAPFSTDADVQDGATWAAGTGISDIGGGVYNDAIANVSSGAAGGVRITAARAFHVNLRNSSGTELVTGVQYLEATGLGAAATGTQVMARRTDTLGTLTPTVDQAASIRVNSRGALWVALDAAVGAMGDTASGATDAGNPVKVGGVASASAPSTVTTGQRQNLWLTLAGAARVTLIDDSNNKALLSAPGDGDNVQTNIRLYGNNTLALYRDSTHSDIGRSISALDAAPNVDTGILAAGAGPGWDRKQNPSNLGTAANSAITVVVDGADVVVFSLGTSTTGTVIFETTADDATWATAASCLLLGAGDTWISAAVTPTTGNVYMVRTTGFRQVRIRTATTLGATVAVKWTGALGTSIIKTMDMAPQPHAIGQAVLNYMSASLGVTTSSTIITGATGQRVYITAIRISAGGTTAGQVNIYSAASGAFTEGTSQTVFAGEFAPSATAKPGAIITFPVPWSDPTTGHNIMLTTTGITAAHIQIQYYIA